MLNDARVVIEHLLKLQHSPKNGSDDGWMGSVAERRRRLKFDLTPRLEQILEDELSRVYAVTRRATERKRRLYGEDAAADALPESCPYALEQVTGEWWP